MPNWDQLDRARHRGVSGLSRFSIEQEANEINSTSDSGMHPKRVKIHTSSLFVLSNATLGCGLLLDAGVVSLLNACDLSFKKVLRHLC